MIYHFRSFYFEVKKEMPTLSGRDGLYPSNDREVHEMVMEWLDKLRSREDDLAILVEGKKDKAALILLGIPHPIIELNRGMNIFDRIEISKLQELSTPFKGTFVILTDWDRKGGMLATRAKKACLHLGVRIDMDVRKDISSIIGKWVKDVESIPAFLSHLDV